MATHCVDRELLNDWHIVADRESLSPDKPFPTCLLGVDLVVRERSGRFEVIRSDTGAALKSAERYGFVWTCLDKPWRDIVFIPEANEADRHLVSGGSIAVKVSGLRAVENFLDMGHFPFVHTGWLGEEPHTEVAPYNVEITAEDEVLATECKFYQPIASPTAKEGFVVDYIYKVMRPYTVALYKSNPIQKHRLDVITLFVQPVDEENCIASLSLLPQGRHGGCDGAQLHAIDLRAGQTDSRKPDTQAPAARPACRNADPRRCRFGLLPALAARPRRHLRRHTGAGLITMSAACKGTML
ncbi:hypothetical protein MPLSOD_270004 [Mesorhizobium sp. SOD10]|nr:hypothetical protein MPLSOD_270004 [Mesorhizobium sp. SOD10]